MAAQAELRAKLTLDDSQFMRGMKAAEAAAVSFGTSVAQIAATGIAALTVGLTAAAVALEEGVRKAYALGAEMKNLSERTGIAVDQMLILQRAGKDHGIDDVSESVKFMQEHLIDSVRNGIGPTAEALSQLGLKGRDLVNLLPTDQMRIIGERITAIRNPALRASEAFAIFGKSGASLLPLLRDGGAMARAAESLGKQAQILKQNAAAFYYVNERLSHVGDKLMGFFVGVAETILPAMKNLVDLLDSIDLAEQGERFGAALETGVEFFVGAFQHPEEFLDVMVNALKGGLLEAAELMAKRLIQNAADFWADFAHYATVRINYLTAGIQYAGETLGNVFKDEFKAALEFFDSGWGKIIFKISTSLLEAFTTVISSALDLFLKGMVAISSLSFGFNAGAAGASMAESVKKSISESIGKGIDFGMSPKGTKSISDFYNEATSNNPLRGLEVQIREAGATFATKVDFGARRFLDAAGVGAQKLVDAGHAALAPSGTAAAAAAAWQAKNTTLTTGGLVGASMAHSAGYFESQATGFTRGGINGGFGSSSSLTRGAYNSTDYLLSLRQRRAFQNAQVANGALSADARSTTRGGYHVIRSGDRRRSRNVAAQRERENQKNIASNIAATAANTGAMVAVWGGQGAQAGVK